MEMQPSTYQDEHDKTSTYFYKARKREVNALHQGYPTRVTQLISCHEEDAENANSCEEIGVHQQVWPKAAVVVFGIYKNAKTIPSTPAPIM